VSQDCPDVYKDLRLILLFACFCPCVLVPHFSSIGRAEGEITKLRIRNVYKTRINVNFRYQR